MCLSVISSSPAIYCLLLLFGVGVTVIVSKLEYDLVMGRGVEGTMVWSGPKPPHTDTNPTRLLLLLYLRWAPSKA